MGTAAADACVETPVSLEPKLLGSVAVVGAECLQHANTSAPSARRFIQVLRMSHLQAGRQLTTGASETGPTWPGAGTDGCYHQHARLGAAVIDAFDGAAIQGLG